MKPGYVCRDWGRAGKVKAKFPGWAAALLVNTGEDGASSSRAARLPQ